MADRGALDAAITAIGTEVANLLTLAQGAIAKGQSTGEDYTPEIAQLTQIGSNITTAIANANAAAASPDVPQSTSAASLSTTAASNSAIPPASNSASQPTSSGPQEAPAAPPQS